MRLVFAFLIAGVLVVSGALATERWLSQNAVLDSGRGLPPDHGTALAQRSGPCPPLLGTDGWRDLAASGVIFRPVATSFVRGDGVDGSGFERISDANLARCLPRLERLLDPHSPLHMREGCPVSFVIAPDGRVPEESVKSESCPRRQIADFLSCLTFGPAEPSGRVDTRLYIAMSIDPAARRAYLEFGGREAECLVART